MQFSVTLLYALIILML